MKSRAYFVCLMLAWIASGCSEKVLTLKPSSDWLPKCHDGRLQIKVLPNPENVQHDYTEAWKAKGCRFYYYEIDPTGKQLDYKVSHPYGDTPMGAASYTEITFKYIDASGKEYQFKWYNNGIYEGDFLRLESIPIQVLTYPYKFDGSNSYPILLIVGIKGFERH